MKKFVRWLVAVMVTSGLALSATGCVPRKFPAPDDEMTALEYHQSSDRADWMEDKITADANNLAEAMLDGDFGRVNTPAPGRIITEAASIEYELKDNGEASKRVIRVVLTQTDERPEVSFEAPGDDRTSWNVCHGPCSEAMAKEPDVSKSELIEHEDKALTALDSLG